MEDVMRFPSINDVSAELRRINKETLEPDDADEGIDVRLQVMPDSTWTVNWGSSDYDQDHRGYWGSSSVPGNNRRFDSKDIARDLIEQAREHKATGGDDDGVSERRVSSRKQPSLPGFPDLPDKLEIRIPNDMPWKQIGGDMNPSQHGGIIATADGDHIELLEIQPVRAYVSDDEAKEVGFPFWTKEAWFDLNDLDLKNDDVQSALQSSGFDQGEQKVWFEEDATPEQRALVIAESLLSYGSGTDEGPSGWSEDLPDHEVEWQRGNVAKLRDYLSDEDDEFRREVLGEEDEEEEEDEDEEEEDEDVPEADAKDILEGLGKYFEHEGHDAAKESARIARLISSASNSEKVDKVLEEVDRLVNGNGIEPINGDYHVDNFYHDIVALYVNMGDTYETTLLYETDKDRFLVTSWGDWVEHNERKYKIS